MLFIPLNYTQLLSTLYNNYCTLSASYINGSVKLSSHL